MEDKTIDVGSLDADSPLCVGYTCSSASRSVDDNWSRNLTNLIRLSSDLYKVSWFYCLFLSYLTWTNKTYFLTCTENQETYRHPSLIKNDSPGTFDSLSHQDCLSRVTSAWVSRERLHGLTDGLKQPRVSGLMRHCTRT